MATSAGYPADAATVCFYASTYVFVLIGLILLWRTARRTHVRWSGKLLPGSLLMEFGLFNGVEGLVDHHLLGLIM